jgi:hypothetical protein
VRTYAYDHAATHVPHTANGGNQALLMLAHLHVRPPIAAILLYTLFIEPFIQPHMRRHSPRTPQLPEPSPLHHQHHHYTTNTTTTNTTTNTTTTTNSGHRVFLH